MDKSELPTVWPFFHDPGKQVYNEEQKKIVSWKILNWSNQKNSKMKEKEVALF